MKPLAVTVLVLAGCILLFASGAVAQPIGFNWSEQTNLATDSGGALLDANSTATVIWDKDKSGLGSWSPANPVPDGDEVVLDFTDNPMTAAFGSGPFAGQFVGSWSADDADGWTQDGEMLYLLAYVPAAVSSSGLDEYGVSAVVVIAGWPNNFVSHDIVGGGPITTAPVVHVNVAAVGPGTGSEADPYPTIQAGLTAAPSGAVVLVAHGTYSGVDNTMLDFGGKSIWLKSKSGPRAAIIDGDGTSRLFSFTSGEGPGAIVDGFTIQNGNAGVGDGGGIYALGSSPTIMNCIIKDCLAANGGAISFSGGPGGGGIINCLVINNEATDKGGGVHVSGTSAVGVGNSIAINIAVTGGGACIEDSATVTMSDTITLDNAATNGHEFAVIPTASPSTLVVRYSDVLGGSAEAYVEAGCTLDLDGTNIDQDPEFVSGLLHDYYLSHIAAGQASDSPCIDTGGDTAANRGMADRSTSTNGDDDAGQVDMGYHAAYPLWITDVSWDQTTTEVVLEFTSKSGATYDVESVDANEYSDALVFSTLTSVGAPGVGTTVVTDDLTLNPLTADFRFYRIHRTDKEAWSWQTAGVFELDLNASPAVKFISTPLIPDADHGTAREIFGETAARQVPRNGFQVSDLDEATGAISRLRWDLAGNAALITGSEFDIDAGVGYELFMGFGPPIAYTLRLTGYVPTADVQLPVTKSGVQSLRWMAYSMPRARTLDQLGLETAVTPWSALNRVRLLQPGSNAWQNYQYDTVGGFWYDVANPGVPAAPPLSTGLGIVFLRFGPPDASDMLTLPRWYASPPNEW